MPSNVRTVGDLGTGESAFIALSGLVFNAKSVPYLKAYAVISSRPSPNQWIKIRRSEKNKFSVDLTQGKFHDNFMIFKDETVLLGVERVQLNSRVFEVCRLTQPKDMTVDIITTKQLS